jgi:hypothetical protein
MVMLEVIFREMVIVFFLAISIKKGRYKKFIKNAVKSKFS